MDLHTVSGCADVAAEERSTKKPPPCARRWGRGKPSPEQLVPLHVFSVKGREHLHGQTVTSKDAGDQTLAMCSGGKLDSGSAAF